MGTKALDVLLLVLLGALLISVGYALGRSHSPGGTALFWVGQALLLLPVAWRVLESSTETTERLVLLAGGAAAQALVVFCYSPDRFRFPDELQHVRTAEDILQTGHLFTPNSYLAVSPGFPGLEEVATAVSQLTGLSLFHAGVLTVSLAHTILPVAVYLLLWELSKDERLAAVGAVIYTTCPHNGFFNTLFIYAALALPFLVLTLRGVVRALHGARLALLVPPFLAVLITHHLTALAALGLWGAFLAAALIARVDRRLILRLFIALLGACAAAALWTWWYAPTTFGYLGGPFASLVGTEQATTAVGRTPVVATAPTWETGITLGAAALTGSLVALGFAVLWRSRAPRLLVASAALGLAYPLVLVIRVLAPGGAEIATRGLTYVELVAALPAAIGLVKLYDVAPRLPARLLPFLAVTVLVAGSVTAGLPPSWERLPGTFHVAAFESGLDESVAALGPWAQQTLSPNQGVACDFSSCSMLGAYGRAELSTSASGVYYAANAAEADSLMERLGLSYLVVDRRLTSQTPMTGTYFLRDVQEGQHLTPLAAALLDKFDADPLLDRIYDNGNIQIYATSRTWGG